MRSIVACLCLAVACFGCSVSVGVSPCEELTEVWNDGITIGCMGVEDCCLCDCWNADRYVPDPDGEVNGLCVCVPQESIECTPELEDAVTGCLENPDCVDSHRESGIVYAESKCAR